MRFVCVLSASDGTPEAFADAVARVLRLIEHSDFDWRGAALLRRLARDRAEIPLLLIYAA